MGKERLYRYSCEACGVEVIADEVPTGWLAVVSTTGGDGGRSPNPLYGGPPPAIWSPNNLVYLPKDAYWCAPSCLSSWVATKATETVDGAKLKPRYRAGKAS